MAESKWMTFKQEFTDDMNRPVVYVRNKKTNDLLGVIQFYPRWKQFVFVPEPDTIFNSGCMQDLINYIKALDSRLHGNDKRKADPSASLRMGNE